MTGSTLLLGAPVEQTDLELVASIISGSHLYGTALPSSDVDTITVLLPNREMLMQLSRPVRTGGDRSLYVLHDFVHLLIKGAPNIFELLYAQPYESSDAWDRLVMIRNAFATNKVRRACEAWAMKELKRLRLAMDGDPTIQPGLFDHQERFDYDTKAAAHVHRLLYQMLFLAENHRLEFPLPVAPYLLSIRKNEVSWREYSANINDLIGKLSTAFVYPPLPDMVRVTDYLHDLYLDVLGD